MEVTLALLADYANVSREGKLNIMGIFDVIHALSFPARHPQMQLVMRFESDAAEAGTTKDVEVQLIDEDGKKLMSISGQITLGKGRPGEPIATNQILTLNNMGFEKPGNYEFKILIQEEVRETVRLKVVQMSPQS